MLESERGMGRKARAPMTEKRDPSQKVDGDGLELTSAADGAQSTATESEFTIPHNTYSFDHERSEKR